MKRVHLWVSGAVQGVWFRESMRQEAERRRVRGWVRNIPDGRVEAVLEGEPGAVEALVHWSRRGPERARVAGVEAREEPAAGGLAGFRVER